MEFGATNTIRLLSYPRTTRPFFYIYTRPLVFLRARRIAPSRRERELFRYTVGGGERVYTYVCIYIDIYTQGEGGEEWSEKARSLVTVYPSRQRGARRREAK